MSDWEFATALLICLCDWLLVGLVGFAWVQATVALLRALAGML